MRFLTKELLLRVPPVRSQDEVVDPLVVCTFFLPGTHWTWYVIEGSTRNPNGSGWGEGCEHRPLTEYEPARDDCCSSATWSVTSRSLRTSRSRS